MLLTTLYLLSLASLTFAAPSFTKRASSNRGTSTKVKIVNNCKKTIQLGQLSNNQDADDTTVSIHAGGTKQYTFNGNWSGRFWARQGCTGSACQVAGAAFPASLAEFTFLAADGKDFYDISFVDGYNLPVSITPTKSTEELDPQNPYWCGAPACGDMPTCPKELQLKVDGIYVGCLSACSKFGNPEYCCSGAFGTPDKCPINKYAAVLKDECPDAYSFAYDDEKSLYQCRSSAYTVTWCP
ncbi:thaumatin [Pilaira anomala]|nr:thaumatin [Pilaira anomala]